MPKGNESTTKFKADISQLKASMQEAARQVRLANSEFKAATAGMDNWGRSADGLSAKVKQLDSVLSAQKRKLADLTKQYELTAKEQGENSKGAQELLIRINNQKAAIGKTEAQLGKYEQQLEDCKNGTGDFADATDKATQSTTHASDGFTVMKGALASLVADGIRLAVDGLKDLARETFNAGANFESAMSKVEAVSGASGSEMEALTDKAKEMGETTKFSATESAEAFNYMAMAGWKTEDMIDGISGIMNLAAASGEDLATTSDIVTDALTAMGYSAKDSGKLADVMAAASSNANTNVAMMGETFQYAAPIVGALGYSMEDTAVAIGLMANAGIKGEKAGTALRSTLTRLSAPPKATAEALSALQISVTDSNKKMKPFSKIIQELRNKFDGLSETQKTQYAKAIAGQQAMSGLLAIVNAAPKDFEKLTKAVDESNGAAQDMANTMNDNVSGQITLLKSKIEGVMIKVFEKIAPTIKRGIDEVSKAIDEVNWDDVAYKIKDIGVQIFDAFKWILENGPLIKNIITGIMIAFTANKIITFTAAISGLISKVQAWKAATEGMSVAQRALNIATTATGLGPMALAVAGVTAGVIALTGAVVAYVAEQDKAREKEYGLSRAQKETIETVKAATSEYKEMDKARDEANKNISAEYGHLEELKNEYNTLIDSNGKVKKGYEDRANFILNELAKSMGIERSEIQKLINKNGKLGKAIDQVILKKQAEATLSSNEDTYKKAIDKKQEALEDYNKAMEVNAEQQKKYDKAVKEGGKAALSAYESMKKEAKEANVFEQTGLLEAASDYYNSQADAIENYKKASAGLKDTKKTLQDAEANWVGYNTTIKNYEGLSAAIISGDAKKIKGELANLQSDFISAKQGTQATLQSQIDTFQSNYNDLAQAVKNGAQGVSKADLASAKALLDKSKNELLKYFNRSDIVSKAKKSGLQIPKALSDGIKSGKINIDTATKQIKNAIDFSNSNAVKKANELGVKIPKSLSTAIMNGKTSISDATKKVDAAVKFTRMAKTADIAGKKTVNAVVKQLLAGEISAEEAGKKLKKAGITGMSGGKKDAEKLGTAKRDSFVKGITSNQKGVAAAGKKLPENAKKGADTKDQSTNSKTSGANFVKGFIRGLTLPGLALNVNKAAFNLAKKAINGLRKGQKEGSPSKITTQSGIFFGQGYNNGINSMIKAVIKSATNMGTTAVQSLRDAQEEHSPAKLTFKSGVNFVKGYINGIVKEQGTLIKTIKNLVKNVMSELLKLENYNFSEVGTNASSLFSQNMSNQIDYMLDKMAYQNEKKLASFDSKISKLEAARDKKIAKLEKGKEKAKGKQNAKAIQKSIQKQINATKKAYNKQIKEQEKFRDAYQASSSKMIEQFTSAMNEYQSQAQKLIDDTINGVTDKYQAKYDALISKQDNLIEKLKNAGNLFEISGANVMSINDIKKQTQSIKDYVAQLQKIKEKVSSDLFDQIATYDMDQGSKFMEYLLSLSDADLKAYSDAYDEKMQVAESLSENLYKNDFKDVADDYAAEIKKAMKGLPNQLEELGEQTMQGFLNGLTKNTDYMTDSVKTLTKGIVDTFKKELDIHSPSGVTEDLGEFTGIGFGDGLRNVIKYVKNAANDLLTASTQSLDGVKNSIGNAKATVGASNNGIGVGNTNVTNNYNLVQNNTSPKALTPLETYKARQQQIAMVKAATQTI